MKLYIQLLHLLPKINLKRSYLKNLEINVATNPKESPVTPFLSQIISKIYKTIKSAQSSISPNYNVRFA